MRRAVAIGVFVFVGLAGEPAMADMRALIAGGAPTLPTRFVPLERRLRQADLSEDEPVPPAQRDRASGAAPAVWAMPLIDQHPSVQDKAESLAPELLDAILRIESFYDPTRIDPLGEPPPMDVRPGTASMNNVFADRWRRADTDANVHERVKYLAEAWLWPRPADCDTLYKNRSANGGPVLSALDARDCARVLRRRTEADEPWTQSPVAVAAADLPIFAAPLPGARLSSQDFWAAQRARIQAIQARLRDKWHGEDRRAKATASAPLAEASRP